MNFTKYFSLIVNSSGPPHLDTDAFKLFMNIVHLEGRIAQLQDLIAKSPKADEKALYTFKKGLIEDQIKKLTGSKAPEDFLSTMILKF